MQQTTDTFAPAGAALISIADILGKVQDTRRGAIFFASSPKAAPGERLVMWAGIYRNGEAESS